MDKLPEYLTDDIDKLDDVEIARQVFTDIARYYNPNLSDHNISVLVENSRIEAVVNEAAILTDLTREQCQERAAIIGYDMGIAYFSHAKP